MVKGVAQDVETCGSVDICHVSYPVVPFLALILIIARRQYRDHVLASPNMIAFPTFKINISCHWNAVSSIKYDISICCYRQQSHSSCGLV